MEREKTNSITALVKIVAREEIEKFYKTYGAPVANCRECFVTVGQESLDKIRTSLVKAGQPWSSEEDSLLIQEVRTAVAQIALNHHRSAGAIRSRISAKDLLG